MMVGPADGKEDCFCFFSVTELRGISLRKEQGRKSVAFVQQKVTEKKKKQLQHMERLMLLINGFILDKANTNQQNTTGPGIDQ